MHPLFSVAPMMELTDRHYRYLARLMSSTACLYTEMITTGALLYNDPARFLKYHPSEQPLVLQLGGSDPKDLAAATEIAVSAGFKEVNLNVGCPSPRVQCGGFGASLMAEPDLVAQCVAAMRQVSTIPITVKCRTGIDDIDSEESLENFVKIVSEAGCDHFIVHARKAWLNGLSPKENREIPPLEYEKVYRLKEKFPWLTITINGGIKTLEEIRHHLKNVDGVMLGREAYYNAYMLTEVDLLSFPSETFLKISRKEVIMSYLHYMKEEVLKEVPLKQMARHLLGLFHGIPGGRFWRRLLTLSLQEPQDFFEKVEEALSKTSPGNFYCHENTSVKTSEGLCVI